MTALTLHPIRKTVLALAALIGMSALLPPPAAAQAPGILVSDSFAPGWQGEVSWTGETTPRPAAITLVNGTSPLTLSLDLGKAGCIGQFQESARISGGRVIQLKPVGRTSCDTSISSVQLVAVNPQEIGIIVISGTGLAAQGKAAPRGNAVQLAIPNPAPEFSPDALKGPATIVGQYFVSSRGSVYEFLPAGDGFNYRAIALSTFEADSGIRPGEILGRARYSAAGLALSLAERVRISPETQTAYRHCPAFYGTPVIYDLIDMTDRNAVSVPETMAPLTPRSPRYCTVVNTSRNSCRVTSCAQYNDHDGKRPFLIADRALALQIGAAARAAYVGASYAEALARLKRAPASGTSSGGGGYFNADGPCAPVSCEQEDTLQFLMDQYWD